MEQRSYSEFAATLGVKFHDLELLREAFTHRSYLNEAKDPSLSHNERLEFLGDAVLELLATAFLYERFPKESEGTLTSFRAALVRTESLADEATRLEYGSHILMSRGEENTGGRSRPYILANTFEAVIGALYLDQGLDACRDFLSRVLFHKMEAIASARTDIDAKSRLQEIAQERFRKTPVYRLDSESGPDHDKRFAMTVIINDSIRGTGEGRSKQEAEQFAAAEALRNLEADYKK